MKRGTSALAALCAVAAIAFAQTAPAQDTAALQERFRSAAAEGGPQALLGSLDQVLSASPDLAADPASAARLANAAAAAAGALEGARSPLYRAIIARIEAAAPVASRERVGAAAARAVSAQAALAKPPPRPLEGADVPEALAASEGRLPEPAVQPRRGQTRPGPEPLGFELGSFVLYPDIVVAEYWDDNIFATDIPLIREEEDWVTVIAPSLDIRSQWQRHAFNVKLDADLARYAENESENSDDYRASAEGRYDFSQQSNFFGGALHMRDHEERSSPDDVAGFEPTVYHDTRLYAGVVHGMGDFGLRAGATLKHLDFDDTPSIFGLIDNDDRDRNETNVGVRVNYSVNDEITAYVQGTGDFRRYSDPFDAFGFDRDSTGYRAGAGLVYRLPGRFSAEGFLGHMRQNYDDPSFKRPSTVAFYGNAAYKVTDSTTIYAWADRSIEETTLFGSPAYLYTGAGLSVDHYLRGDLVVTARASWENSDFYQSPRSDDDYDMGVTLKYFLSRRYFVAGDYRFQHRDSTINLVGYDRNQVFLRVGAQF